MNWLVFIHRLPQVLILEFSSLFTPHCRWRYALNKWKAIFADAREMDFVGKQFQYEDRLTPFTLFTYVNEVRRGLNFLDSGPKDIRVLEIGANIGGWGYAFFCQRPTSSLFSFEPNIEPFTLLKENSASFDKWIIFNFGVGELDREVDLHFVSGKSAQGSIYKENASLDLLHKGTVVKNKITIRPLTSRFLQTTCGGTHFDFIKIDVEGAEIDVIKGIHPVSWEVMYVELSLDRKGAESVDAFVALILKQWPSAYVLWQKKHKYIVDIYFKNDINH